MEQTPPYNPYPSPLFDKHYEGLTKLEWPGSWAARIPWERQGNNAFATFDSHENAKQFVYGYLDFYRIIKRTPVAASTHNRAWFPKDGGPTRSLADQIHIPDQPPANSLVKIRIPLGIVDPAGLKAMLDHQEGNAAKVRAQIAAGALPLPEPKL